MALQYWCKPTPRNFKLTVFITGRFSPCYRRMLMALIAVTDLNILFRELLEFRLNLFKPHLGIKFVSLIRRVSPKASFQLCLTPKITFHSSLNNRFRAKPGVSLFFEYLTLFSLGESGVVEMNYAVAVLSTLSKALSVSLSRGLSSTSLSLHVSS